MMISSSVKIVKKMHVDDETTGGKDIWIATDGSVWTPTQYSKDDAPTGLQVGYKRGNTIYR